MHGKPGELVVAAVERGEVGTVADDVIERCELVVAAVQLGKFRAVETE